MHHTVMVFGEEAEEQLEGFCEDFDVVSKLECDRFAAQKKQDPNAVFVPRYLERVDITDFLHAKFVKLLAQEKNQEDTLEEYVFEYYFGEIQFIPKNVYESRPEMDIKEYGIDYATKQPRYTLDLSFGKRFAVLNDSGKINKVIEIAISQPKWDWFELGGRWKNFFLVKTPELLAKYRYEQPPSREEPLHIQFPKLFRREDPRDKREGVDSALKKDIDFEHMRKEAREEALANYDKFHEKLAGQPYRTWDEILAQHNGDQAAARRDQENDPVDKLIRSSDFIWYDVTDLKELRMPREAYGDLHAKMAISTYALLKDETWEERESWQSEYTNPKFQESKFVENYSREQWADHIWSIIESVPDDTRLSVYDYHS